MKSSYFNKISLRVLCLLMLASCNDGGPTGHAEHEVGPHNADTSVIELAKASGGQLRSDITTIEATAGKRIFSLTLPGAVNYDNRRKKVISSRVSGRIERLLVNYNYERVKRGQKIMELYSPDLAAAQRELIFLQSNGDEALLEKAKMRLRLLGMSTGDITNILKTGEILFRVPVYSTASAYIVENSTENSSAATAAPNVSENMNEMGPASTSRLQPAQEVNTFSKRELTVREGQYVNAGAGLFTVYETENLVAEFSVTQELVSRMQVGQKILFYPQHNSSEITAGTIGLIEPVFRNNRQFNILRVYLSGNKFRAGELLTARVPVVFAGGWWLPEKAVWISGPSHFVFRKEEGYFKPYEVDVLASVNGNILVGTDITEWQVASNAAYLADSERFIQPGTKLNNYEE